MKNPEIFVDYDMVVCMTKKTINDQLTHLTRMGVIKPELILVQAIQNREYVYEVLDSPDKIPRDADGNPTAAYIDGHLTPQVEIAESGTNITFVLSFRSGTAYFWQGNGPLAELVRYDMTGWKYGISITLDLKAVEKDDIADNSAVPQLVKDQLYHFISSMFSVNSLFMDFESTDLMRFDPAHTDTSSAGDVGIEQLVLFMNFYLKDLQRKGNPYILGYSLTTSDKTNYDPDQNVPDALRPVGTTFTLYHDPVHSDLSNLNFVLATKGGHGKIVGTPGNFDTNWISPTEQSDAKMIYSHSCLVEQFILRPFFDQFSSQVFTQIKDNISVDAGKTYDNAKTQTATGFAYTISDVTAGDDQYVNTFSADFSGDATNVAIDLKGHLAFYKGVDKNMGFCHANAHASGSLDWSMTVTLATVKDAKGEPTLKLSNTPVRIDNSTQDSDKNDCAKAFEWIGKILGGILDALTFFGDKGFFSKLLDNVFDLHIPGIGNVGAAFGNLAGSVATVLVLPAGQVFFFKSPAIDTEGNLAMQLTYKAEN